MQNYAQRQAAELVMQFFVENVNVRVWEKH